MKKSPRFQLSAFTILAGITLTGRKSPLFRERGLKMKRIWIVLSLTILLFPAFVSADCVDLERFTNWVLESSHTVVFYTGEKPLARLEIPNCEIHQLSIIRLIKSYVCDSDEIMIDGTGCRTITVQVLY